MCSPDSLNQSESLTQITSYIHCLRYNSYSPSCWHQCVLNKHNLPCTASSTTWPMTHINMKTSINHHTRQIYYSCQPQPLNLYFHFGMYKQTNGGRLIHNVMSHKQFNHFSEFPNNWRCVPFCGYRGPLPIRLEITKLIKNVYALEHISQEPVYCLRHLDVIVDVIWSL